MAQEEYELKEIRPGHFAKLVDGEVVGMASELEILIAENRNHVGHEISPSIIEVSVAITSLTAVLATLEGFPRWLQLSAFAALTLSGLALTMFIALYLVPRVPRIQVCYCRLWYGQEQKHLDPAFILATYPILVLWIIACDASERERRIMLDFAHATLAAGILLAGLIVYFFAALQIADVLVSALTQAIMRITESISTVITLLPKP
jgi:hypothetical protein